MRRLLASLGLGVAVAMAGCAEEQSGGPGVRTADDREQVMPPHDTFRVNVPNLTQAIKQGESQRIDIKIDRETNFDQDVTVSFEGLPQGVTIEPPRLVIPAGEEGEKVTLQAASDAALGEFEIVVNGTPTTGAVARSEMKIKVEG